VNDSSAASAFAVTLRFHGDLPFFLKRNEADGLVVRSLREKTSVKDVIESCGVPHTEVDLILCEGAPRDFRFHLTHELAVEVYPRSMLMDDRSARRLQRRHHSRFVVDGHLGKLARDLRLLGFDTVYRNDAEDAALLRTALDEERALLTRDRRLLMHAAVRDGYCPRSQFAEEQLAEVMRRFDLAATTKPYTRCLRCNGGLERVAKEAVIEQLEPLTKIYYDDFRRCSACGHVYWAGSHFRQLEARIDAVGRRLLPAGESEARG
jgi:uncharacterized protein with PIN domain